MTGKQKYRVSGIQAEDQVIVECSGCGPMCVCQDMAGAKLEAAAHLHQHGVEKITEEEQQ